MKNRSTSHYDRHLAAVYAWMVGGTRAAIARAEEELDWLGVGRHGAPDGPSALADRPVAVDLGAGFGAHAIPLARRGLAVIAVDDCAALLAELRENAGDLPVQIVHDDMLAALEARTDPIDLLLCMGDTLTHLESRSHVHTLCALATRRVRPGGRALLTFRDYASRPEGERDFVCVRSDASRIATCGLEIGTERVRVHDLLHERNGDDTWALRTSSYEKLRLEPTFVEQALGPPWRVECLELPSGLTAIAAERR
jgi:SAM-dependent methyltransferase